MLPSLAKLRIGGRLALSFSVVVALILSLATFNLFQLESVREATAEAGGVQAERLALAQEWRQNIAVNAQRALAVGLSSDLGLMAHFEQDIKRSSARTSEIQRRFAEIEVSPEGKALQDKMAEVRKRYLAQRDLLIKTNDAGDTDAAAREAQLFKPIVAEYIATAGDLVRHEELRSKALADATEATMSSTRTATIATAAGCVLIAMLLGWLLHRSIVVPLVSAQAVAERIAAGNLAQDLTVSGHDEVSRLVASLGHMQGALRELVGHIRRSVDNIGIASAEVASGNQDLSARTEQAAANLQQTASSVEQMAVAVRQSAASAAQANQLAESASEVAGQGGRMVVEVVSTMDEINASSKKISDIIGVIDGIAFQTNILALNAAVEAARAGEQGRGFAVVATEVRHLAQRSAEAAREIKVLIGASVERIEAGAVQVQRAGETMHEIVESVRRVSGMVAEISAASGEQAQGIGEVNRSVSQLDQVTQQNAALVEESAAAAQSLKDQAVGLATAVQRFQLR